jgi:hypothetical protein
MFSSVSCFAETQEGQIIATIKVKKLHLSSARFGTNTYSVVDNGRICIAQGKELWIIKNDVITQKIICPSVIDAFDINKHGNGAIASGGTGSDIIIYRIKAFQLQTQPIKVNPPGADGWSFIYDLSLLDDSTMRLTLNVQDAIILTDFGRMEKNQYTVLDDTISRYLSGKVTTYVGHYENEFYFFESTEKDHINRIIALKKDNIEQLMAHPSIKQRNMERSIGRIIELGDLGRRIPISNPIRLDESAGIFYVMLVQKGSLVIRKFDIKDFGLKK